MKRSEREAIMWQGVSRAETARDREQRRALEEDVHESPLAGKPLPRRLRNFRPDAGAMLQALGGPPAWMRRLRRIELAIEEHERNLADAYLALHEALEDDPAGFGPAWRAFAAGWRFDGVNELIERHNRNYPAESRLAMNPRTGDFVLVDGRPYTREPLDAGWILERFPTDENDDSEEWNRSRDSS